MSSTSILFIFTSADTNLVGGKTVSSSTHLREPIYSHPTQGYYLSEAVRIY